MFVCLLLALLVAMPVVAAPSSTGDNGGGKAAAPQRPRKGKLLLEVDHLMIHVTPGAPEREALTRAGFTIAPDVNQHEGQGSTSIMVELGNGFLELTWRDPSVPVSPGLERVAERFQRQSEWRESGWSPFGIGLRRARGAPRQLPFTTRAVRGAWMQPGDSLEIVSAANDTAGPRLWVVPPSMAANGRPESASERDRLSKKATFLHANGARVITGVRMVLPQGAYSPAAEAVEIFSPVEFTKGGEWLLEVTFDRGRKGRTKDLRPELPVVCRF